MIKTKTTKSNAKNKNKTAHNSKWDYIIYQHFEMPKTKTKKTKSNGKKNIKSDQKYITYQSVRTVSHKTKTQRK